jgi:hypothetical protein
MSLSPRRLQGRRQDHRKAQKMRKPMAVQPLVAHFRDGRDQQVKPQPERSIDMANGGDLPDMDD